MTLNEIVAWRDAAVADGWSITPTYNSEGIDRASTLDRDGWKALILTRSERDCDVVVWSSDRLVVTHGTIYSFEELKRNERLCSNCGSTEIATVRIGFAGRVCPTCREKLKPIIEYSGWCN